MNVWTILGLVAGGALYVLSRVNRWQRFSSREQYKSDLRAIAMRKRLVAALSSATVRVNVTVTTPKEPDA